MKYMWSDECYHSMSVHSSRHLAEWADLIGASLPKEYVQCDRNGGNSENDIS